MRYALVSDIHANLQAWNAVLLDIRSLGVDRILCLGDIVGYGPSPVEVIESVYAHVDHILLGNHDAVIAGKLSPGLFNPGARRIIEWTGETLGADAVRFLDGLPMVLEAGIFRCVHGDFSDPASFRYIIEPADAVASWEAAPHPLLFAGHTHLSRIFLTGNSGRTHCIDPVDFEMEDGKRYLVNVGSVGQPRNGRVLASYCIFDADRRAVFWRDIPFDIDAFARALSDAGLPDEAGGFLRHDPRKGQPPLRSLLDFAPARTNAQRARNTKNVESIEGLAKRVRRWRTYALLAIGCALFLLLVGLIGVQAWRRHGDGAVIPARQARRLEAVDFMAETPLVKIPPGPVVPGEPLDGWRVELGRRRGQSVAVVSAQENAAGEDAPGSGRFRISSDTATATVSLRSNEIRIRSGMKFRAGGFFLQSDEFSGTIALVVRFFEKEGRIRKLLVNPNIARRHNWRQARRTFEPPAGCYALDVGIEGRFSGWVLVDTLVLERVSP